MNLNTRISFQKALYVIGAFSLMVILLSYLIYDNFYKTDDRNIYELRIQELKRVLDKEPDNLDARLEMAMTMYLNGQHEEAVELYQKILKQHPQDLKSLFYLGLLYSDMGRYQEAALNLEKVVELQPEFQKGILYYNLGVAKINTGNYREAIEWLNTAVKFDPGSPMAYYNLGIAYYYLKDFEKAAVNFEKAREFGYEEKEIAKLMDEINSYQNNMKN